MCYYSYDDMQQPHKLKLLQSLFQMKAGIACLISQRSKQWKWDPSPVLSSEPELITVSLGCLSLWHCSYLLHLIFIICCIQCPNWFIVLDPYKPASLFILFVDRIVFVYQGRERGKQRENMFVCTPSAIESKEMDWIQALLTYKPYGKRKTEEK